jgi:hypothetical protein
MAGGEELKAEANEQKNPRFEMSRGFFCSADSRQPTADSQQGILAVYIGL